jgi:predicted outer membrane repeat protein
MDASQIRRGRNQRRCAMRVRWMTLLISLGFCWNAALAATLRVAPDGSGDYPTIQAAIDATRPGDTVELSDGTYQGPGNRNLSFLGKAITVRSQHGNPKLCVIDCQGGDRGLTLNQAEGPGSVLRGVTIANGASNAGGAAYLSGCSPTFITCIFRGNSCPTGGAIYT